MKITREETSNSISYNFFKGKVTQAKHQSSAMKISINKQIHSSLENITKYPKWIK